MGSRAKGKEGERDVARLIRDLLGVRLVRNLHQAREGGCDLVVHPEEVGPAADVLRSLAIEVKRRAKVTEHLLARFWRQAREQAGQERVPCLIWREDRQPWRVTVPMAWVNPELHPGMETQWTLTFQSLNGFAAAVRDRAHGAQGTAHGARVDTEEQICDGN